MIPEGETLCISQVVKSGGEGEGEVTRSALRRFASNMTATCASNDPGLDSGVHEGFFFFFFI